MSSHSAVYDSEYGDPPVKLVIFDCDGVLIDSEIISLKVLKGLLADLGVELDNAYFTREFLGRSFSRVKQAVKDDFNVILPDEFEQQYLNKLIQVFDQQLAPVDGIKQVLSQLNIPFCVATSSHRERTDRALKATGLTDYFGRHIYTASQVKRGKPEPDLFLFAANQHQVQAQNCLVIEDSMSGLQAGIAAGMQVWHFQGGSHMPSSIADFSLPQGISRVISHWSQFFNVHPELHK
ncbi:HAD-IA family hydrolase [Neptunicella marina]|uniref:HAD family hydrolase n=1 Tax=Neptunicella marina TaxID=2125989 RepID=A0A8J6ITV4_9ALTE|nr:HAD family hydrolase [Neptunicella marina]